MVDEIIKKILDLTELPYTEVKQDQLLDKTVYRIVSDEPAQIIGAKGNTLKALTVLVKKISEKKGLSTDFTIDVNDYKEKKINQIKETTLLLAQRAKTLCYDVEMQPMSSYERMIVHTIIEKEEGLTTESIGKGKERRVVIKYVG